MSKGLKALKKIEKEMSRLCGMDIAYDGKVFELFRIVGKELQILDVLKEICLEGKDKYGEGTWGWVEFDLDQEPKLKEWLKDEH